MDIDYLTAHQLNEKLKNKEISAAEIIKSVYSRIEAMEKKLNSYIRLEKKSALKKAEEVDKLIGSGGKISDFGGIPLAVKDNICTKGVATTCASKILENYVPVYNATVVDKLKKQDYILIGKANQVVLHIPGLVYYRREPAQQRRILLPVRFYVARFTDFLLHLLLLNKKLHINRRPCICEWSPVGLLWPLWPGDEAVLLEPVQVVPIPELPPQKAVVNLLPGGLFISTKPVGDLGAVKEPVETPVHLLSYPKSLTVL